MAWSYATLGEDCDSEGSLESVWMLVKMVFGLEAGLLVERGVFGSGFYECIKEIDNQ